MVTAAIRPRAGIADRASAARLFHALSDETRLAVLEMLRAGERCVCDLQGAVGAAQSRLSFHLRVLKDAGLVTDRKDGRWSYYAVNPERLAEVTAALGILATPTPAGASLELHSLGRASQRAGRGGDTDGAAVSGRGVRARDAAARNDDGCC